MEIENSVIEFLISKHELGKLNNIASQEIYKKFKVADIELDLILRKLEAKGIIDRKKYRRLMCLTLTGLDIKENGGWIKHLEMEKENRKNETNKTSTIIAENYIGGDNYGIQSSKSDFTAPITINAKQKPSINPEIKSSVQNFFSNPWVLLISGIAIEEITLGKIYKFIISII
ncbi:hypothetical protein DOS84_18790 [Flavobacterium aquariorum]|uniref:Uncharacterized protein n=1 Tax=Flavobacterium aquariorum TaxID=2217670 RepID=A0A2W7TNG8_9FLAO|nr:hypothetical protein [Flavobacterium aquariorum]PZX91831.1 hypothetical protein DOS84_18790 [Flavobacterium aquariorum]